MQDGITAFEALESGVLHPLRELLAWLEGASAGATARPPTLTAGTRVAAELERDAVDALALVTTSPSSSSPSPSSSAGAEARGRGKGAGEEETAGSVAVVEVGCATGARGSIVFLVDVRLLLLLLWFGSV